MSKTDVLPNFMHFTVFNNAGKEKPNIRKVADILNRKDIIGCSHIRKSSFSPFCFFMRWQAVECWITNPNRIIQNQRKICRPSKGLIWNDENKKFPNHYLQVRFTISVSRKALKNPSFVKNPRTNKKSLSQRQTERVN